MDPQDFMKNLESMDPVRRTQMMALLKAVGSPPEPIMQLLDRLQIPWERKPVDGVNCVVIKWGDFMDGERKLQEQGPILKRLVAETATSSQLETNHEGPLEVPDDRGNDGL